MKFKPVFTAILAMVFVSGLACKKSGKNDGYVDAVFTGEDMRACVCCGGLLINFEGKTQPAISPEYYQVKNDPASLGISSTDNFPIFAKVIYTVETTPGCGTKGFVNITSILIGK